VGRKPDWYEGNGAPLKNCAGKTVVLLLIAVALLWIGGLLVTGRVM
jgi:hypothetical protein